MKKEKKQTLEDYLKEAKSWESDKVRELIRSRKVAWCLASIAVVMAMLSTLAVILLSPLKTVEPFVIRVDNRTGIVDVVTAMQDGKTTYEESVNKYFVKLYLRYREGYLHELAIENYNNVGLLSGTSEQKKYSEYYNPKNPDSPINIYGPNKKVSIKIFSTTFIKPGVALVRFSRDIDELGTDKIISTYLTATIIFDYISKNNLSEQEREINPLGFHVIEYRVDADSSPQEMNKGQF